MKEKSDKSYGIAVSLSAVFGFVGIQHFYLGRIYEGIADVILTACWVYYFAIDKPEPAYVFLALDFLHSFITTIRLLIGNFTDGRGAYVCYPGQKLN